MRACMCVCARACMCMCVVSVIVKHPVLPPCVVEGCSRNPLYYYYYYLQLKKSQPSDPAADPSGSDSDCPVHFKDEPNEDCSEQQTEQSGPCDGDKGPPTKQSCSTVTVTADNGSDCSMSVTEKVQVRKWNQSRTRKKKESVSV